MIKLPQAWVVDASVVVKLFLPEANSELAQRLFERMREAPAPSVNVPDLLFVECANVLWKRVRWEGYPEEWAKAHIADLRALGFHTTPTSQLVEPALAIACEHRISAYDACYVALSELLGLPLFTADSRLAEKLKDSPFSIIALAGRLS